MNLCVVGKGREMVTHHSLGKENTRGGAGVKLDVIILIPNIIIIIIIVMRKTKHQLAIGK